MISDINFILTWWFLIFSLGLLFLPIAWIYFKNFLDLGYPFSKIIAILLISYFVWLTGSLKIVPFSFLSIWAVIFFLAAIIFLLTHNSRSELVDGIKTRWKIIILEEIFFLVALLIWSYIRGFQPDIEGLEKFMDFGFMNSILRSSYFPPADMWMAGKTINYYYFGHLVAAVLTKLSNIDPAITYNLMIATVFAFAFTATFSLAGNIIAAINPLILALTKLPAKSNQDTHQLAINKKAIIGGLISAALLTLGGNLHTLYWFFSHRLGFEGYWYPDATRFIVEKFGAADNTIHEFPIYSFIVSDLHGHVSDIPFVLLFLALLFSFVISNKFSIFNFQFSIPLALVLAVMYMTNSWDFPIYFLILGLTILWINYQRHGITMQTFSNTLLFSVFCLLFSVFLLLPFQLHFSSIAQGLDIVHAHSPFWQLLVLWGYQWIISIIFIVSLVISKIQNTIRQPTDKIQNTDTFIFILIGVATFLIIIPEAIYVKDIYIDSYHRANTVFKLVYQSFMMYALASGYIIIRVLSETKSKLFKFFFLSPIFFLLSFVLIYPYFGIKSYYRDLKDYRQLYGLRFLQETYPDDFSAVLWLNKNVTDQPAVLEAVGDSYTDFDRVSMATGLPTVEGWLVHEWLWRDGFEEPGKRASDVETIFTSKDLSLTTSLLKKYNVRYVFLGAKEVEKYKINESKFKKLGTMVFESGNTKIYLLDKLDSQQNY